MIFSSIFRARNKGFSGQGSREGDAEVPRAARAAPQGARARCTNSIEIGQGRSVERSNESLRTRIAFPRSPGESSSRRPGGRDRSQRGVPLRARSRDLA